MGLYSLSPSTTGFHSRWFYEPVTKTPFVSPLLCCAFTTCCSTTVKSGDLKEHCLFNELGVKLTSTLTIQILTIIDWFCFIFQDLVVVASTNHVLGRRSAAELWRSRPCRCQGKGWKWFCDSASVSHAGVQVRSADRFLPPLTHTPCTPLVFGAKKTSNNLNRVNTPEVQQPHWSLGFNKSVCSCCRMVK